MESLTCSMEKGTFPYFILRQSVVIHVDKLCRYVNMDYAFTSAIRHTDVTILKVSYDIACQWHKALYQRMDKMPTSLQLNLCDHNLTFLVPKFHLPAHIPSCQWSFSFNWSKGVRRTDGEEPEQGWANLNLAASSMKDMGPGHHRDTLDDYFGDWNWKKLIGLGLLPFSLSIECFSPALLLGPSILRKIKEAVPKGNDHRIDFKELSQLLKQKFPEQVALWMQQVEAWEADSSWPNPFEVKSEGEFNFNNTLLLQASHAPTFQGSHKPVFANSWQKTRLKNLPMRVSYGYIRM